MKWSGHRLAYKAEEDKSLKLKDKNGLERYSFKKGSHHICV